MQALLKVDTKVSLAGIEATIQGSESFLSENVVLQQLKRLKRNRSPGLDDGLSMI